MKKLIALITSSFMLISLTGCSENETEDVVLNQETTTEQSAERPEGALEDGERPEGTLEDGERPEGAPENGERPEGAPESTEE